MKGLRSATSFLTRLPLDGPVDDVARGVPWFPVVGALLGLLVTGVYAAGRGVLPAFPAAALGIAAGVWATGAFHEDGLADTADALGGGSSRDEALRILKDPRLGTYGVSALVGSLVLRVALLAGLDVAVAVAALPAAHALSRAGAVGLMAAPVATSDGLGSSYASVVTRRQIFVAVAVGALVGAASLGPLVVAGAAGVLVTSFLVLRLARRKLGGITGDVMGAAQQVAEIVVLLTVVAAARRGWTVWWIR